ncbi:hypothetical protein D3C71_1752880 [compost metagenome]
MALSIGRQRIGRNHLQRFHFFAVAQADLAELLDCRLGFEQHLIALGLGVAGIGMDLIIRAVTHKAEIIANGGILGGDRRRFHGQQRCRVRRRQSSGQHERRDDNFHLRSLKFFKR